MNISNETLIAAGVGILGALATILAALIPYFLNRQSSKHKQKFKFVYVKFVHLRNSKTDATPIYQRFVRRLNKDVDVFDEVHRYSLNTFHKDQDNYAFLYRSSGIIDVQILHPWQENTFFDKMASITDGYISQTINQKSNIYFTETVFINGFQPGHEDMGIKMVADTDETRFIVDFSYLPDCTNLMKADPKGYFRRDLPEGKIQRPEVVHRLRNGVFELHSKDLKKDDVLRIEFDLNWEAL